MLTVDIRLSGDQDAGYREIGVLGKIRKADILISLYPVPNNPIP